LILEPGEIAGESGPEHIAAGREKLPELDGYGPKPFQRMRQALSGPPLATGAARQQAEQAGEDASRRRQGRL
jgi:hypothetical protein